MASADFSSASLGSPASPAGAALQKRLNVLARRRNTQKMTRALVRAAIPGVGLAALSIALYKFHIIADGPVWAPAAMIGVCLLWGVRNGLMQRAGSFAAACDADRALGLNDRLSSGLAFAAPAQVQRRTRLAASDSALGRFSARLVPRFSLSTSPAVAPTSLVPSLVDEAAARAQNLDGKKVYPLRFDRPPQILTVLSLLLIGALFLPDHALFQSVQERKQVAAMQSAGEKLVEVAKTVRKTAPPTADDVKHLSQRLQQLGQKMVRGRMTKRAALTEMGDLRQQLQKAQQKPGSSQSGSLPQIEEALRQAPLQSETGRKVQEKLAQNKPEEAAKALEQLADKVQNGQVSPDEKKKAAEDLEKTARDLRSRGGAANQQAAKALEDAAKQLKPSQSPHQQQEQQPQSAQNGPQKNGSPQQGQQNGQQQPKSGQQQPNQQGQSPQSGQKQPQQGQNGQQSQQQNGQNQSGAQQGQQQQQQGGQQGQSQPGQSQQGQGQQQGGQQGAADALRNMANGLRQGGAGGSNSQGLQDMLSKIRDAENQTGTNGGEQSGQGKAKAGQSGSQPGQGQGKNVTPGKDLMPSDPHGMVNGGAGLGPRNNAQGNLSSGGVSKTKANRTGDKRRYQDVWSDRLPKTHKQIDRLKGKWGNSGEVEQMPTKGDAKGGEVKTPYYQAYESAKRDAEEAVGRESVPPEYKQPVKDYFESIKP